MHNNDNGRTVEPAAVTVSPATTLQANAGPVPGDRPLDRLVNSYPLPIYPAVTAAGKSDPSTVLVTALERIALNIYGDTVPQVVAGNALDEFKRLTSLSTACPDAAGMGEHACTNSLQCWEPCGKLGKDPEHVGRVEGSSAVEAPATVDDLATLVRQLVRKLAKADPANDSVSRAAEYLRRKGLDGNPLR